MCAQGTFIILMRFIVGSKRAKRRGQGREWKGEIDKMLDLATNGNFHSYLYDATEMRAKNACESN